MTLSNQYLAGLFDGEGYIGLVPLKLLHRKNPSFAFCLRVVVSNTYLPILKMIKDKFGGGLERHKTEFSRRLIWHWRRQGWHTIPFLKSIQPYSTIKKPQIDLALEYLDKYKGDKLGNRWKPVEEREKTRADKRRYVDKFKQLKRVVFNA